MNKIFIVCLGLALFAVAGCRTRYDITTTSGTKITGVTKPQLDRQTGQYVFQDAAGRKHAIPQMRVSVIEPQGTSDDSNRFQSKKPEHLKKQ